MKFSREREKKKHQHRMWFIVIHMNGLELIMNKTDLPTTQILSLSFIHTYICICGSYREF